MVFERLISPRPPYDPSSYAARGSDERPPPQKNLHPYAYDLALYDKPPPPRKKIVVSSLVGLLEGTLKGNVLLAGSIDLAGSGMGKMFIFATVR